MQRPRRLTAQAFERWRDERPRVAVGIPMTSMLHRTAVNQFLFLAKHLRDDDVFLPCKETAVASEARNTIIHEFLKLPEDVEYLFLFDDDMTVDVGTIELMTWRREAFLSGLCVKKQPPFEPVISLSGGFVPTPEGAEHYGPEVEMQHVIANWDPNTGVREVDGVGAACLCLSRDLLRAIPAPWFKFEAGGEDLYFCRKVRAAGYRVLVDTHVLPGHIGEHVATYADWIERREAVMAAGTIDASELRKVAA